MSHREHRISNVFHNTHFGRGVAFRMSGRNGTVVRQVWEGGTENAECFNAECSKSVAVQVDG